MRILNMMMHQKNNFVVEIQIKDLEVTIFYKFLVRKTKKGGNFVKQCYSNYADEFIHIVFTYYWSAATFGAKKYTSPQQ